METSRRYVFAPFGGNPLPLYVETAGCNPNQEKIVRPRGYPFYHWLQTGTGEGKVEYQGKTINLQANSGILLFPDEAHTYEAVSEPWSTRYLTFGGAIASGLLQSLSLQVSSYFSWETDTPFSHFLITMLNRIERQPDIFGLSASADVYRFLITLTKYGQLQNHTAISYNLKRLEPLTDWMEEHFDKPDIGLDELAALSDLSARRLNDLFRETFSLTPYAYLLHVRIRKAKQLLIQNPQDSVKEIARLTGFRDVSHFVATFRKTVGFPPQQFRKLH